MYPRHRDTRVRVCVRLIAHSTAGDAQDDDSRSRDSVLEACERGREGEVQDGELVDDGQQAEVVCARVGDGKARARENKVKGASFERYSESESLLELELRTWR